MSSNESDNTTDLMRFLQTTLDTLDEAAGDVDHEAHSKLAELKQKIDMKPEIASAKPLLSEQSIFKEISRLEDCLSEFESKVALADPMTQELLSKSAEIITNTKNNDQSH